MATHALEHPRITRLPAAFMQQARWLVAGFAVSFLVPYVFADVLDLPRDLYYAVYVVAVLGFFTLWAQASCEAIGEMVRRRWQLTAALTALTVVLMALIVLRTQDASAHPDGLTFAGAIAWRGLAYGFVDGLLLSAFPILAVFAAFKGTRLRGRALGKVLIGIAALAASLVMTATYHVGYSDFRSDKVQEPLKGDVFWSAPTLLTLNPLGAPVAHAGMHVTAVIHSYDTNVMLPPHDSEGR
jgi:hypothetical protein